MLPVQPEPQEKKQYRRETVNALPEFLKNVAEVAAERGLIVITND